MKVFVSLGLLVIILNWLPGLEIYGQMYSFPEIMENLFIHRPQTGDQEIRENSICSIDDMVLGSYVAHENDISKFYQLMLEKAKIEIKTEKVEKGVTVWQIYNHGFIVKTPSVTLGFDLYDYLFRRTVGSARLEELADVLDVMFISHDHTDHVHPPLRSAMKARNKPVIEGIDPSTDPSSIIINVGDSIHEKYLQVTDHEGLHSVTVHMFEVVTPEGYKIFHTGDNQTSVTLPEIEGVDILLLNAWVNESGRTSHITGSRNAITKINPRVTLPGHILELGHLGGYIVPYSDVFMVDDLDLGSKFYVLAWGERYHFDDASNDSVRPNPVANPQLEITNHSVNISWEHPALAGDGESASFYRIISDKTGEFFTTQRKFSFEWDAMDDYPVIIHSYDDCGNQCTSPLEFTVTVPDVNYAPRILNLRPSNQDTTIVFGGVHKVFSVEAIDPNGDPVTISWQFDGDLLQDESENYFIYDSAGIDAGIHHLTVIATDHQLSEQHTWVIDQQNLMATVDNTDTLMYSEHGSWRTYIHSNAFNGSLRYSYLNKVGDWARYLYYPEITGYYDVHAFIPNIATESHAVFYYVLVDKLPIDTIEIDQVTGRGKWLEIGQYYFTDSSEIQIKVVNNTSGSYRFGLVADAIRFTYVESPSMIGIIDYHVPFRYSPLRCFPNPFNVSATITFNNPESNPYTLYIVDIDGKLIRIENNIKTNQFVLEKRGLKAGYYIIELRGPIIYRGKILIE